MGQRSKHKTIKALEENIGERLCEFQLVKDFVNKILKAQSIKEITDKLDFIKTS